MNVNNCTKCSDDNEGADFWEFGEEKLCQMCWESHCDKKWWEAVERLGRKRIPNYYLRVKNGWEIVGSNYGIWRAYLGHHNFSTFDVMREVFWEVFWEVLDDRGLNL